MNLKYHGIKSNPGNGRDVSEKVKGKCTIKRRVDRVAGSGPKGQRNRFGKVSDVRNRWPHLLATSPSIDWDRLREEAPQDVVDPWGSRVSLRGSSQEVQPMATRAASFAHRRSGIA